MAVRQEHQERALWSILSVTMLVISLNVPITFSFPSGAPKSSCFDMTPHHHAQRPSLPIGSQKSTSPYRIAAEASYTSHAIFVRGVLIGEETFKGFILQARPEGGDVTVGEFVWWSEGSARTLGCGRPNDTLTHPNVNNKQKVSFIWTTDRTDTHVDNVRFWASVVKSYGQFWTNIQSKVISLKENNSHSPTSLPMKGTNTASAGGSLQDLTSDQQQQKPRNKSTLFPVGNKTPLTSTSMAGVTESTPRTATDRKGIKWLIPSSTGNQSQFQQRPPFWKSQQQQQQKFRPQNFSPNSRQIPPFGDRQQPQQTNWVEPSWFGNTDQGFPLSDLSQSRGTNGQRPRNRWGGGFLTSPMDGDLVTFMNKDPLASWSFSPDSYVTSIPMERNSAPTTIFNLSIIPVLMSIIFATDVATVVEALFSS